MRVCVCVLRIRNHVRDLNTIDIKSTLLAWAGVCRRLFMLVWLDYANHAFHIPTAKKHILKKISTNLKRTESLISFCFFYLSAEIGSD